MRRTAAALLVLVVVACSGCRTRHAGVPAADVPPQRTLTLIELVEQINANNGRITSVWATGTGEARLRERPGEAGQFVNLDLTLMYLPPGRVRLTASKDVAGAAFDLGTDGERFFLWLPTERTYFRGTYARLDPQAAQQVPIRPDLIPDVLAVGQIPTDLLAPPAPTLRFNPDADAYMLTFVEPPRVGHGPPRLLVTREVWYDRATLLPTLVILFDPDGRPTLRAYLSNHAPTPGGGTLARRYELYFPPSGTTMSMRLDDVQESRRTRGRGSVPNDASFVEPGGAALGAREVVDLDTPAFSEPRP